MSDNYEIIEVEGEVQDAFNPYEDQIVNDANEVESIVEELRRLIGEEEGNRNQRKLKWAKYRRQLDAQPESELLPSNPKMPAKSNVVPPLAQINGQTMYAKLNQLFNAREPFWTAASIKGDMDGISDAKLLTKYLSVLAKSEHDLDLSTVIPQVELDSAVMPVCFAKVAWTTRQWRFRVKDGPTVTEKEMIYHDGPEIIPISVEDCIWPSGWRKVQDLPWIDHQYSLPEHEFRALVELGYFNSAVGEEVLEAIRNEPTDKDKEADQREFRGQIRRGFVDLDEVHFFRDIEPKDGIAEDMIWTIHFPTGRVVRMEYNEIGARGFQSFGFMPKFGEIESRGTGQLCESMQDEATGIHNLRNENMKFANQRMLAMRRSVAVNNKESIYAGKIWITDNPREDIAPIQFTEVYGSSLQAENATWSQSAQAVGIPGPERGFSDPTLGTRDTYKGQALRLGSGQGIFASIAEKQTMAWSRVGMLVVYQLIRNRDRVLENERRAMRLTDQEIDQLDRILSVDISEVPQKFAIGVRTTDVEETQTAMRESIMVATNIYAQYAERTMPLAMQLFTPQGMQMLQQVPDLWNYLMSVLSGSTKLMAETFKLFKFEDTERYLPDLSKWELIRQMMNRMSRMAGQMGGLQNEFEYERRPAIPNVAGETLAGNNVGGAEPGGGAVPGGGAGGSPGPAGQPGMAGG